MKIKKIKSKRIYFEDRELGFITFEQTIFYNKDMEEYAFFSVTTQDSTLIFKEETLTSLEKIFASYFGLREMKSSWVMMSMSIVSPSYPKTIFHKVFNECFPLLVNRESYNLIEETL